MFVVTVTGKLRIGQVVGRQMRPFADRADHNNHHPYVNIVRYPGAVLQCSFGVNCYTFPTIVGDVSISTSSDPQELNSSDSKTRWF